MISFPKALPFLFLTELWERFGFYVVQGLLVLYMAHYFNFSDDMCFTISGIFMGLVYIAPLVGGYLADRVLGFKTAIIWGGLFLTLGYGQLALFTSPVMFYLALATIVIGNGLLKPNVSSLLGMQYEANDPDRDTGFTIFYIGINIGVALSGLSGYIRDSYGWQATFALASLGMIIGLLTFCSGFKYIRSREPAKSTRATKTKIFFYCIVAIIGISFLLKIHSLANVLLPVVGVLLFLYLGYLTLQQPPETRYRFALLNILIIASILFWTLFWQLFYSANLFVDRLVEKSLFGLPLTTTVFYASESVFILTLGPLFAWIWQRLAKQNKNPAAVTKFMMGIFSVGLGFLILSACASWSGNALVNPLGVFLAYMVITIGELLISPIGLSAVTALSPPNLTGMMMGVWFVATGLGGICAGWLARLSSVPASAQTIAEKLAIYHSAFMNYACLAFVVAILLFFVRSAVKNWADS